MYLNILGIVGIRKVVCPPLLFHPIAVMLNEHEMGRQYVKAMSQAYATYKAGDKSTSKDLMQNAHGYISLLKDHIEKENTVLFVMADGRLSEKRQDELFEGFEKIEEERIGVSKHEEFYGLLKKLMHQAMELLSAG